MVVLFLTVAIDVYSRMITGFFISLDSPSYFSVSQCLTQALLQKDKLLRSIEVEGEWNIWGIPKTIGLDNAGEFRGYEMQRACENYGIELNWRPVARPQYGAHIERLIGTSMKEVHTLPGTTFSNIKERGEYNSDKYAQFTLQELEQWYTEFIINVYHKDFTTALTQLQKNDMKLVYLEMIKYLEKDYQKKYLMKISLEYLYFQVSREQFNNLVLK